MKRRDFIYSFGALLAAQAVPSFAAINSIDDLNAYFNSVRSAYGPFVQTDANGTKVNGRFYMQKPGKMRFEYDDKRYPLTVSDGAILAIFDPKSNKGPQKYPQAQTPVSLLAKDNVDLTGTKFVRKIKDGGGVITITLADPANAKYGSLLVRIDKRNPRVLGWQSIDQSGRRTTIEMKEFKTGVQLKSDLFNIVKIQNSR